MARASASEGRVLESLEGRSCDFCEEGTLSRGTYKTNVAAVCDECGTPCAQFW